ncbi:ABC transporter ATP-binding protein [Candidatus Saccharibacteria bacterium]|jgi:ATP-binding cassette subfamily B protein|nr:ABC transporter ATP-binding protein [Candidatus Saccharibacteria bacterium]MBP7834613.1 ABC transporter ATP-binding protein [Candidatus Saccharibacteria bacterium]
MKDIWKIITFSKSLWRYYLAISIFTVFLSLITLFLPLISGWAIDEMQKGTSANIKYMVMLAAAILVIEVLSTFGNNISGYWGDQLAIKLNKLLSSKYYQHLLQLPQSYFDKELSGKIINRLNRSINQITNFMQMMSNNFLQFIFSTVFALAIVAYYSWQVALLLGALYPVYIFLTLKTSNKWQNYQKQKNLNIDIASGRFAEAISQIKVVKSFIQEKYELSLFNKYMGKAVAINKPQSKYWHKKDVERRLVLNIIFFLVYLFIFVQGAKGVFSPGQAVALILFSMQIRIPIFTISFLVDNTQKAIADSKDYFEVMNTKPDISDEIGAEKLVCDKGAVQFNDVSFGYGKKQVLKKISFAINSGEKIALVGESGEGKTTLVNLLMRLYDPISGQILIDGQDISKVTQQSLRSKIGVVFQEPALFSGTLFENIAYSNIKSNKKDVISASKSANADDFISKFDKGYDTEIGERGLKLSGGQKQRIAIARALLKDAPILILDEATSSLDSKSEVEVQKALDELMKNRTTIIIAHRLSTIAHVDKIITIKNGKVDEIGKPSELALTGGIYAQLLNVSHKQNETAKKQLKAYDLSA